MGEQLGAVQSSILHSWHDMLMIVKNRPYQDHKLAVQLRTMIGRYSRSSIAAHVQVLAWWQEVLGHHMYNQVLNCYITSGKYFPCQKDPSGQKFASSSLTEICFFVSALILSENQTTVFFFFLLKTMKKTVFVVCWKQSKEIAKVKRTAQRGARTHGPEIKSLMLYRLS